MSESFDESGSEFELRALNVARAIHDPFGLQGAIMHRGQERDGVFVSEEAIHVYEFTVDRKKEKSRKDASKVREILGDLQNDPKNRYKALVGWCVSKEEPTAEQRGAVQSEAKAGGFTIHAISISVLQARLCNSEAYLRCRDNAPFGSLSYTSGQILPNVDVPIRIPVEGQDIGVREIADRIISGRKLLLVGEFGVGKSYTMRKVYEEARRLHFRKNKLTPFPVHINLRDCVGLKTPAEILRRHSEEIGFSDDKSLISAWRSGACVLLLDGFDEVVPTRWLGSAADLKQVRWEALAPVRRLVQEAPGQTGIAVCGRAHYFSSQNEMAGALGFSSSASVVTMNDFSDSQVAEYLNEVGIDWSLPEWLPTRPLLIGYLVGMGAFTDLASAGMADQASAWRNLFDAICTRESRMFSAVRPETVKMIVSRVATLARSTGDETGPVGMETLRNAFIEVNGRQPDEEGIQILLRLPGLAIPDAHTAAAGVEEQRVFVDRDLADTAYGEDLASYVIDPYDAHPLSRVSSWANAASDLGTDVATQFLESQGIGCRAALAAASRRQNSHQFDAVLSDTLRVASNLQDPQTVLRESYHVEGVIFDSFSVAAGDKVGSSVTYKDCVIQSMDISGAEEGRELPHFQNCLIGFLDGASVIPGWLSGNFIECEIERFSTQSQTTAGIMQLPVSAENRVALTILKKIYGQRGSGRKEGALSRGLDPSIRLLVPRVLSELLSSGWVHKVTSGRSVIYLPVKGRRADALRALEKPGDFAL
ncbi:NACHT domain-containing protein [Uniformispora flossi]|uniref:NACHT domain-containing protein n=1 Tax=Uniformispora flossi TaxID=3390723 RepID=UPI003C2B2FCB